MHSVQDIFTLRFITVIMKMALICQAVVFKREKEEVVDLPHRESPMSARALLYDFK